MTNPAHQAADRIAKALEAGPTPGEWMYQGTAPFTTPDDAFAQWGEFRISANSLDLKDDDYYRIGSVSNRNGAGQNEANAALIAACSPDNLRALLAERDEMLEALKRIAGLEMDRRSDSERCDRVFRIARAALTTKD